MTKEVIYNVEEFLRNIDSPIPIHSIRTYQNTDTDFKAPKYLTEITYLHPETGEEIVVLKNTLKIARLLVSRAKYGELHGRK